MELNITIRLANHEDAGLIADLSRKTFFETFGYVNTKENMEKFMNDQFDREKLISEVHEPENIFLLAFDGEQPVGYAKMREGKKLKDHETFDSIEISRIYVINTYIGTGTGRELMRKCLWLAKEMKKDLVWLGVWKKNERAISFYTSWGFEKFGEQAFFLGDDKQTDWLMKKELTY